MSIFDDILHFHRQFGPKPSDPKELWCINLFASDVADRLGIKRMGFVHGLPSLSLLAGLPIHEWSEQAYFKDLRLGNTVWLPPVPPERGVWILFHNGSSAKVEGF